MTHPAKRHSARSREIDLVLATATTDCGPERRDRIRSLATGDLDWTKLLIAAGEHGTSPLVYRNLNRYASDLVPPSILAGLREACHRNLARNLLLTGELGRIEDDCQRRGIRLLSFKGPTLAALAYEDLALRQFVDLDLLVRPQDFEAGCGLLSAHGYHPRYTLTPEQQRYHMEKECEMHFVGEHSAFIELHISLTDEGFPLPCEFDELWSRRQSVTLAGHEHWTLSTEDLCLFLAVHLAKHRWESIGWVCDYAQLLRPEIEVDWARVLQRSGAMRCEFMTLVAASLAERLLDATLPAALASACTANGNVRSLVVELEERLFSSPSQERGLLNDVRYHLLCRKMPWATLRWLARRAFTPQMADWEFANLPRPLWFLYTVLRPIRLLAKRMKSPLLADRRNSSTDT